MNRRNTFLAGLFCCTTLQSVEPGWKTIPILAFPLKGKETGVVAIQPRLRVHQCQHTLHDLIDVQAGGIEEDGVFGRPQRRHRALGITGVAGENLA